MADNWWTDWAKPNWMGGSPYLKFPEAGQPWWRDPKGGYHTVYNPYWGWQDYGTVKNLYQQSGWNPAQDVFEGWGLTQQPGESPMGWQQYYPGRLTKATDPNWQGGGGQAAANAPYNYGQWSPMSYQGGQMPTSGGPGFGYQEPGQAYQQFQYPQQWGQAAEVLGPMAYTGMPTPQSPWYQQAKGVAETDIRNAIAQANEQMGMKGLRWSTPAMERGQRIAGEIMGQTGLEWTGRELDAQEQARQRQLAATGQLAGLGQQYFQAPMDYASATRQQALAMQQARQNMFQPLYQEFLRTSPESSPWLRAALAFSGINFPQAQPQMYQPSGLSQFLDALIPF